MDNALSPADITALTANNGGTWESMIWLFAILILFGGGFGGYGGNGTNVVGADLQRGFDNQNDMANQREILSAVNYGSAQGIAATNQTFHDNLMANQNLYNELQRDIAGLGVGQANILSQINECCCTTKQLVMQNNYDSAIRDAETRAAFTAEVQGVKDMIAQNKIEALQAQINALELKNATAGMMTFPNSWSFDAGKPPFCNCTSTTAGA